MTTPLLTTSEVAALLRMTPAALLTEASALPADALRWHPAPGEWCLNEVAGHLIEAERRGFGGRIRDIIDGKELLDWDPPAVARERNDCARDGLALLRELDGMRAEGLRLVEGLTPEQLTLSGMHPLVGELRIVGLLHEWVWHDREHLMQALAVVRAYVWPNLANSQKFSELD